MPFIRKRVWFRFTQTAPAGLEVGRPAVGRTWRGRERDDVRAWCVKETGGALDWLGCRDFDVEELRTEPGRQGMRGHGRGVRDLVTAYNYLAGLQASAGGGRGPLRPRHEAALPVRKPDGVKTCQT